MPTERGNGRYYIQRNVPGIGDVYRSLGTDRKRIASRREDMILSLAQQGRQSVVRAWLDGDVTLAGLQEAYESGKVHELTAEVRRNDATLGDACVAALKNKKPDVKASTLERYTTGLDHFRDFAGDTASVRESLSEDMIQGFKAHRLDEGAAEQTVNNDLGAVSILVTYALKKGWIDERPKIKRYEYQTRIRYLEREDIAAYMAGIRAPFRCQQLLLLSTGIRLGESEALRVCDVRDGASEMRLSIRDAKTDAGVRSVFVPPWAAEAVRSHVEENELSGTERLFTIKRRTVQAEHNRTTDLVGIHEYTIHDHRHTAAVALVRAGMPLNLLQRQLGHKNIDMTMKYADFHPSYNDVSGHFDRMGQMLGLASEEEESSEKVRQAAELLGVDPDELVELVNNSSDNTPTREAQYVAG